MSDQDAALLEAVAAFQKQPPIVVHARGPVSTWAIRAWCDAIGEKNRIYLSDEVARSAGYDGAIAPPAMMHAWVMPGLLQVFGEDNRIGAQVRRIFVAHGYDAVVATRYEQEYVRLLRPGDVLTETAQLESMTTRKTSPLGEGYFVNSRHDFTDQNGELVGVMKLSVFYFRKPAVAKVGDRRTPATNQDNAFWWEGVAENELRIQQCAACKTLRHPPGPMCPKCNALEWTPIKASGRGVVHSFTVHHYPPAPGFATPYAVGLIELEEGPRVLANFAGIAPSDVRVGMAVKFVTRKEGPEDFAYPYFAPLDHQPPAPASARVASATARQIAPLEIDLSATLIVAASLATNDFQPVHHDSALAKSQGLKDIIMNILTTAGLMTRYATEWGGAHSRVRRLSLRLGAPNYPGDRMVMTGELQESPVSGSVRMSIVGRNSIGEHVSGFVDLENVRDGGAA